MKLLIFLFTCSILVFCTHPNDPLDQSGFQWSPYLEWSLNNTGWEGNPFDVSATATFIHPASGETRTTGMFYDGDDTWKFRFTGTREGQWHFTTASDAPDLDGKRGTVIIKQNLDPDIKGFLTHVGNKYAIQRQHTDDLEGYLFNVYMALANFDTYLHLFGTDLEKVAETTRAFLAEARHNGCEVIFVHVNNNWLQFGEMRHDRHNSENPDTVAFLVLEKIITTAHQAGGRVHIWAWGDEQRKWTPIGLPGGINGEADRRLQRYIAARLGPLPGWTMGYGFDLHEWTNEEQVNTWANYLREQLGWPHLLASRSFPLEGLNVIQSYENIGRDVPLTSTRRGPEDYEEIVRHVDANLATPSLYEERHTYNRWSIFDMDVTRRLLWRQAMAGGIGGFIGFFEGGSSDFEGSYPNPEQLRTHYTFWHTHRRFLLDMQRDNELSLSGAYVLRDSNHSSYVIYQEQTDSIDIDLSGMKAPGKIVAVDLTKPYTEIDMGVFNEGSHTLKLLYASDWAIAVSTL